MWPLHIFDFYAFIILWFRFDCKPRMMCLFADWNDNCWKGTRPEYQLWLESNSRKWRGTGTNFRTWLYRACESWKQVILAFVKCEQCIYLTSFCFLILFFHSCYMAATMQVVFSTRSFCSRLVVFLCICLEIALGYNYMHVDVA